MANAILNPLHTFSPSQTQTPGIRDVTIRRASDQPALWRHNTTCVALSFDVYIVEIQASVEAHVTLYAVICCKSKAQLRVADEYHR